MADWTRAIADVGSGAVVGAVSAVADKADRDRAEKGGKALSTLSKYSTYVDYGVPLLGLLGYALGFLRGDWATRVLVAGGTVGGRRGVATVTETKTAVWRRVGDGLQPTSTELLEEGQPGAFWKPQGIGATD